MAVICNVLVHAVVGSVKYDFMMIFSSTTALMKFMPIF